MDSYYNPLAQDNIAAPADNPQTDRITAILNQRAQPAPQMVSPQEYDAYGVGNIASGQGPQAFLDVINNLQRTRTQDYYAQQDRQLDSAKGLYDMFEQKKAAGDKQAQNVSDVLDTFTSDPEARGKMLEWMHALPEQIDASNKNKLYTLFARGKRELGIQTDFEVNKVKANLENQKTQAEIAKLYADAKKSATGGGGGGTTMAVFKMLEDQYPDADKMTLLRIAQNKVGTNLNIDPRTGKASDMTGAADSLGNLKHGETLGSQNAKIETEKDVNSQAAIGKAIGDAEGNNIKKQINAPQVLDLIGQAEKLLPLATSGGLDAIGASFKGKVGVSDTATQADAQLDAVSAGLLNNVPRMEGPQSDADRASYEKAAGDVGNRKKPIGDRIAALKIIKTTQEKYASGASAPSGGDIPQFSSPSDPAFRALPSGSPFIDSNGVKRVKH